MSKATVGRPSNNEGHSSVRERLLSAAKKCFLEESYEKVSTRKVAAQADTSIAMIRYYFGSKEGLYQELIRTQFVPISERIQSLQSSDDVTSLESFFKVYYETMLPDHQFPILIMRTLTMGQGPSRKFILDHVVEPMRRSFRKLIIKLQEKDKIDATLDADMIGINMISLAVMPMLAKNIFEYQIGETLGIDFYLKLAEHNGRLLKSGLQTL
ncbi:TetR/AcrR family transcriptional regulator [Litoribrevibacter albus]|uniref:TetR family transcriptional regulator n=1 Tax=Litoribrevibacter albus TaxID=1473156 RepID=A0AA37SD54_9GAMM|nr:TetR/AcrR family transcriptional regulator [Litoribrevibacter albus]GLQ32391.1 TetR family transcriptional regulator [Litoribrevibacter albus]